MPSRKSSDENDDETTDRERLNAVFEKFYAEIKRRIHGALRRESHPTLQATEIMHDLYLNLVRDGELTFDDTRAVLNLLALKTREYLVDKARRRKARKRGGGFLLSLTAAEHVGHEQPFNVLLVADALDKLARESPRAAEIARLRIFLGLTEEEIARVLGKSRSTIQRSWEFAKVWLADALSPQSIKADASEEATHAE
jgi:RNA polymerase sigma factor (TIGR02999 family)